MKQSSEIVHRSSLFNPFSFSKPLPLHDSTINAATFLPINELVSMVEIKLSIPPVYQILGPTFGSSNVTRGYRKGYGFQIFSWNQLMSDLERSAIVDCELVSVS